MLKMTRLLAAWTLVACFHPSRLLGGITTRSARPTCDGVHVDLLVGVDSRTLLAAINWFVVCDFHVRTVQSGEYFVAATSVEVVVCRSLDNSFLACVSTAWTAIIWPL